MALLGLGACSTASTLPPPITSPPASPISGEHLVTADGVTQYLDCTGSKGPTVVLLGGMDSAADDAWAKVVPELSRTNRVCEVDRAGVGRSPARTKGDNGPVTNGQEAVAALQTAGEPGPYLFVGWSYGGLQALAAADEAIKDPAIGLAGLVLVDGTLPDEYRTIDLVGWEEAGQELDMSSMEPLAAQLNLQSRPAVVLVAGDDGYHGDALEHLRDGASQLSKTSGDYVFGEVPKAGHFISDEDPQAVLVAIREVATSSNTGIPMPPCPPTFPPAGIVCLDGQ